MRDAAAVGQVAVSSAPLLHGGELERAAATGRVVLLRRPGTLRSSKLELRVEDMAARRRPGRPPLRLGRRRGSR